MRQSGGAMPDSGSAVKCELAADVLRSFGTLRFAATGWSMLPTIWPGETLVVERVEPDRVRVGDLVLVGREGRLCAHRVIGIEGGAQSPRWITQGDALPVPDRPVAGNELLGRVAGVIRAGKLIAMPAESSVLAKLMAKILRQTFLRRSFFAARALVFLHRIVRTSEKSGPGESVLPCQG
jgi:signal peptidase I